MPSITHTISFNPTIFLGRGTIIIPILQLRNGGFEGLANLLKAQN